MWPVQVENQLAAVTSKYTRLVSDVEETKKQLKNKIDSLEAEKSNLTYQLDEEKR